METDAIGMSARRASIDMLRGALVIGVIAGHCAELVARGSFLAWIGTGIRMPLFLGLCGFLFRVERARTEPLAILLRRWWPRIILPWLIANLAYLLLAGRVDVWALPLMVFQPSFHLWFVPVMLVFMTIAAITRAEPATLLAWALLLSVAAMYGFGIGHGVGASVAWLPDRRFFVYPIFFYYGLWVARRPRDPWRVRAAIALGALGAFWWASLYASPDPAAEVAAELIWGLALVYLLPNIRDLSVRVPALAAIGRDSLFYYLWHPLVFTLWLAAGGKGWAILLPTLMTLAVLRLAFARWHRISALVGLTDRLASACDRAGATRVAAVS